MEPTCYSYALSRAGLVPDEYIHYDEVVEHIENLKEIDSPKPGAIVVFSKTHVQNSPIRPFFSHLAYLSTIDEIVHRYNGTIRHDNFQKFCEENYRDFCKSFRTT